MGGFAFLKKPVDRRSLDVAFSSIKNFVERSMRTLLVVEDNDLERDKTVNAIGGGDVEMTAVATAAEDLEALESRTMGP